MEIRPGFGLRLLKLLTAVSLISACAPTPVEVQDDPRLNLVILMVDTLRADHMSLYGYHRATTPRLEAMAADVVVFERTRSQAACTFPSVNSFLTSRYPAVFLFQPDRSFAIPEKTPSLAEILSRQGWSTAAVSASPIVRATPSSENPYGGFGRGFDHFEELHHLADAADVNRHGLRFVDQLARPFFLYLHYMDPHDPYSPPDGYAQRFSGEYESKAWISDGNPNPIADMLYDDGPPVEVNPDDIRHLVDLYDGEIAAFDNQLRMLVDQLRDRGELERTIIVLTSDHGEEFMKHDHMKHCHALFEASTRVPLVFFVPGLEGGRRVQQAVQSVDVLPTVLDLLAVDAAAYDFNGRSLRALLEGREMSPRPAFADQGRWRSADDGRYKLLLDAKTVQARLFDLVEDPDEQHDLWGRALPEGLQLDQAIRAWLEATEGGVGTTEALEIAEEREEQLRALGYLQ